MKSFDSIEKSIEERLDPNKRTIGESEFRKHDQKKNKFPASKIFQIEFSESVPEEIKSFLKERLQGIIDFPTKFGMNILPYGHLLRFVDKQTYESEVGTPLPKKISLPASKIKYISNSRSFKVMIILPEKIDTAEAIINITRNLFSKLYGKIFLHEKILSSDFYKQNFNQEQQITASIPEIIDLASDLNFHSDSLEKHCEYFAESYRLSMKKHRTEIRTQLTEEWREKFQKQSLTKEEQQTIETVFIEFKESTLANPEKIFKSMIENLKKLNRQLNYILPHERSDYENFEEKNITHYMRSVINKLEEISSLTGFIEELHSEIINLPEDSDIIEIIKQIRIRMRQLRIEKKVIQFYLPEIQQDKESKNLHQKFPLVLMKMIPKGTPLKDWSKTVQKMEKHYSESIFSKLYLALHYLSLLISREKNLKTDHIKKNEIEQRLKKLLAVLKYHKTGIKTAQNMLGVLLELSHKLASVGQADSAVPRQKFPMEEFKTAWSYFIASLLTLIYYKDSVNSTDLPQGFHAENYTKSILRYVDKQCLRGINYFHIVKLLWLIYEEKMNSDALKFLLFCLQNPNDILCFILNQVMRPQSKSLPLEKRLEKLPNYRNAWITAFQNRLDNALDPA